MAEKKQKLTREERLALPITPQQKLFAENIKLLLGIEEEIPETKIMAKKWLSKYIPEYYKYLDEHPDYDYKKEIEKARATLKKQNKE